MTIDPSAIVCGVIAGGIAADFQAIHGVRDAKRIAALEAELRSIKQQLGVLPTLSDRPSEPNDEKRMPEVEDFLHRGELINAIKVYRKQTGAGLMDAKNAVESIQRHMGYRP